MKIKFFALITMAVVATLACLMIAGCDSEPITTSSTEVSSDFSNPYASVVPTNPSGEYSDQAGSLLEMPSYGPGDGC